jgi:cytochrome c peroxidase
VPAENPITPQKAVLGKILFWDEQLSSDNSIACGTCHIHSSGGSDPRLGPTTRHPGLDGQFNTPDDTFGSLGVVRSDSIEDFSPDALFDLAVQVTPRTAQTAIGVAFFDELFWDGRASGTFVDPTTRAVVIAAGGALESQSLAPLVSSVEMGHESRTFAEIESKLADVEPLRLASNLTPDIVSALAVDPTYPELFETAFGDPQITAVRIAFALATYERTLLPDQTPWDAFNLGNPNALTPFQMQGLLLFNGQGQCAGCHIPPVFSDGTFRNIGLRPVAEDLGRQLVTGDPADRGKFKVPSLRNAGLRERFFHPGGLTDLDVVMNFYNGGGNFADNQDPLIQPLGLSPIQRNQLVAFITGALTDLRVANELPPFDRPQLHSENATPNPTLIGTSVAGTGGFAPVMIAHSPPAAGVPGMKIGIAGGLGGASAHLLISLPSRSWPTSGAHTPIRAAMKSVHMVLNGSGPGAGYQTYHFALPSWLEGSDKILHAQWLINDPAAPGGVAKSQVAEFRVF